MDDVTSRGRHIQLRLVDSKEESVHSERWPVDAREALRYEELSAEEQALVTGYRELDRVPQLAIRCFFNTGDLRLVRAIYEQVFLGLRRR